MRRVGYDSGCLSEHRTPIVETIGSYRVSVANGTEITESEPLGNGNVGDYPLVLSVRGGPLRVSRSF